MSERAVSTFEIPGRAESRLPCTECANRVCEQLRGLEGVGRVECDTTASQVSVEFDPTRLAETEIEAEMERFGLELRSSVAHAAYKVTGLDCPDCAKTLVASVERLPGVTVAELSFASGTLLVEHDPAVPVGTDVEKTVRASGYGVASLDVAQAEEAVPMPFVDRYRTEIAAVGGGVFAATGGVLGFAGAPELAAIAAFAISIAFGGLLVWRRAWASLRARRLDMNVLMSIAVFGAAALGEWGEGATVFFLFAVGGWLESRSLERTRNSIRDLMSLTPPVARVRRGGALVEVPALEIMVGETVIVRPGERVPVDGVIAEGASALDEAPITGESVPADKGPGASVFAGSLNTTGLLEVRATCAAEDSTLARIVYLVEEAQGSRAPVQSLVDRFSAWYTPSVVVLAVLIGTVPPIVGTAIGAPWANPLDWIMRALVMLVVSCPCALVISTPVSIVSAITRSTRDGVLVKGGAFLEAAAAVRAIAFDKTGTLTHGRPEVAEVIPIGPISAGEALAKAAALEAHSTHPLARAVVVAGGTEPAEAATALHDEPARGVRGRLVEAEWRIGTLGFATENGAASVEAERAVSAQEERGRTALVLAEDGVVRAVLGMADAIRPDASAVLAQLSSDGIEHTVMLTGDNERTAEAVADTVGVTGFLARLLPEGKADAVRVLQRRYGTVAMLGDGVNDAPALAVADIGIAMGAAGSDTALESADVALMSDDLAGLPRFLALGRRTVGIIRQNVAFSIAVKAAVLVLALAGIANLWMAVFADTGVSLLVILNGMRLLRRV